MTAALGTLAAFPARADPNPNPSPGPGPAPVAYEFSNDLLAGGAGTKLDVSRFALGNPQLAGMYRADIYVNGRWLQRRDIRLAGVPALLCIDADLLRLLGIAPTALSTAGTELITPKAGSTPQAAGDAQCRTLESLTRDATATFDAGELRVDIGIPQASLSRQPKGFVPPEAWDLGVTAGLLNYNFNAYRASSANSKDRAVFLGLNAGLNIGRWRFRHSGSFTHTDATGSRYGELGTYASTDLPAWQATLTLGDTYSSGQLLSSVRVRGVSLNSDERMLPESQRGYAPVIRGVANSNARVEVRQGNNVLYSTSVPPGPFEINDLFPTGYGGDLQVVVTESDGTQRVSTLPYSSLPQLLRAGSLKYSLQAGRALGYQRGYELAQGTVQYGVSDNFTVNGGLQLADRYAALLGGGAWNTPLGAVQANVTGAAFERRNGERLSGYSLDASWAKVIPATSTNLNFAAYRYSSSGFYSLDDALLQRDADANTANLHRLPNFRVRNRAIVTISQNLRGGLSFGASATSQDYWDLRGRQTSLNLGIYKQIGAALISFNGSSVRNLGDDTTRRLYSIGLTMPIGGPVGTRSNVNAFYTHDNQGNSTRQAGFFGNAGDRGELSYGLSYQGNAAGNTLLANGSYMGKYAIVGANASSGRGVNQQSVTASGGIVAADGHVVFAPFLGDTVGLVHVSGAEGLRIEASQASELDSNGYTLLPYLSAYAANAVELNLSKAPLSARFDSTGATVAPHAGAVVLLNFKRLEGFTLMLRARRPDGSAVPFGASVYDTRGAIVGSVAQAGRIEAASTSLTGALRVVWGDGDTASCLVRYDLPKPLGGADVVVHADVRCEPEPGAKPARSASAEGAEPGAPQVAALPTAQLSSTEPVTPGAAAAQATTADRPTAGLPATPPTRRPVLFVVSDADNRPLPNGAEVTLAERPDSIGVVAAGRVLLRLLPEQQTSGRLIARWTADDGSPATCPLDRLPAPVGKAGSNADSSAPHAARCAVRSAGLPTTATAAL